MNKLIPALALSALLLTGCGSQDVPETTAPAVTDAVTVPATEAVTEPAAEIETAEATRFTQPAETLPDPTEETVELSYSAYKVTYTYLQDDSEEFYTFQGIDPDGNIAWTHESAHLGMAMMRQIMPIGTWEDRFLFNEGGTVVALNVVTGEELWRNEEFMGCFGSEEAALIDPAGFVYLCGGDTPNFFACDMEGNTVLRINGFEDNPGIPFAIRQEGDTLIVTSEIPDGTVEHTVPMTWLPQAQG